MVGHSQGESGLARTRDGRQLHHMRLQGPAGSPTVVFEGGLAASRSYWALVQLEVAQWANAVVYDRSGLGRSPADPRPRPLRRLAEDLGDLLDHLGPGPFVLVGHSWGGPVVRIAAAADPGRIAGLVLVDPTDESCELLFARSVRRAERIGQVGSALLARLGLLGRTFRWMTDELPADARADMVAEGFTVEAIRTRAAELGSVVPDLRALLDHPVDLAEVPLTVISAGQTSTGINATALAAITEAHAFRARQSAHGRHVCARESGHMVPITDPEIIVEEIRRLVVA
ncbi:hypothetical protein KALB_2199 [Kutzneria albida DSM 43870]|uniref:AB hydrolase-1 domain-containing protein n=1 Tax=Kutzneria albida DSM 43870 TaxID=1449976 RepID=W5W2Z5_9PSEU|nr:hypothetical protein KALB_2199 [Kutzneria albida DSM 43870]